MLTEEEAEEVRDFGERNEESDHSPSLWAYASERFVHRSNYDLRNPNTPFQERFQGSAWAMPQRWRLGDWALVMGVVCYPKHWPWALCNVVKREYVREQAATQLCEALPSKLEQRSTRVLAIPAREHLLLARLFVRHGIPRQGPGGGALGRRSFRDHSVGQSATYRAR